MHTTYHSCDGPGHQVGHANLQADEVSLAAKWQNVVVDLEALTKECFYKLDVVTSRVLAMYRFGHLVQVFSCPDTRERHEVSGRNGAGASVSLNFEDFHELVPEVGGAVAGRKAGISPNGLNVASKVHIVHFKVIACHDRSGNRVNLERIGQISANWIIFGAEREDRIVQGSVTGKVNLAEPDEEVVRGWRRWTEPDEEVVRGWRGWSASASALVTTDLSATALVTELAATALVTTEPAALLRKGNRHGCKDNRNGGNFEQHDDDTDTDEDAFEECVCWKLCDDVFQGFSYLSVRFS
jgi:hypothetical protein